MKTWIITWGKVGVAILVAPDMIEAAQIFLRQYGHQIDGDAQKALKTIRPLSNFEIINPDKGDIPF